MAFSRLRILLIAAAALSTIVAGVRGTLADIPSASTTVQSSKACLCDGSREDDSGTLGESAEEDDREEEKEEGGPHLHLAGSASPRCPWTVSVRVPLQCPRCMSGEWHPIATLVHGPPAGR